MRKLLSLVLVLALLLSLPISAVAAEYAKMTTTQKTVAYEKSSTKSKELATLKEGYKFTPIGGTKSYWKIEFKKNGEKYVGYVLKKHATEQTVTSSKENTVKETKQATIGQQNALKKAKQYLDNMAFSREGLIKQLEYEKFSHTDAVYAVDNCGANWNEQAAKKAKQYLDMMAFSREGLIEQLEYEGFTRKQAEYGAKAVGY